MMCGPVRSPPPDGASRFHGARPVLAQLLCRPRQVRCLPALRDDQHRDPQHEHQSAARPGPARCAGTGNRNMQGAGRGVMPSAEPRPVPTGELEQQGREQHDDAGARGEACAKNGTSHRLATTPDQRRREQPGNHWQATRAAVRGSRARRGTARRVRTQRSMASHQTLMAERDTELGGHAQRLCAKASDQKSRARC